MPNPISKTTSRGLSWLRATTLCVFILGFVLGFSGCGGKQVYNYLRQDAEVKVDKVIAFWPDKLIVKRKAFEIVISVENLYKDDILLLLTDFRCEKGGVAGDLKHAHLGIGERNIDFKPNQLKRFEFACIFHDGATPPGEVKLSVLQVYENPSHDGKTRGKAIAKNLVWIGKQ
jgi:hypothetical protein